MVRQRLSGCSFFAVVGHIIFEENVAVSMLTSSNENKGATPKSQHLKW